MCQERPPRIHAILRNKAVLDGADTIEPVLESPDITRFETLAALNADANVPVDAPLPWAPLCSVFRRFLRSRDLKYTQERADVLEAIIARDGSFEAEELLLDLKSQAHQVSKATVYRTIRLLLDAGIIQQMLFDSKQSHYQLIYGKVPRDSMVCMKTGRHLEFHSAELVALRNRLCAELGWSAVGHRFQIYAISPDTSAPDDGSPSIT